MGITGALLAAGGGRQVRLHGQVVESRELPSGRRSLSRTHYVRPVRRGGTLASAPTRRRRSRGQDDDARIRAVGTSCGRRGVPDYVRHALGGGGGEHKRATGRTPLRGHRGRPRAGALGSVSQPPVSEHQWRAGVLSPGRLLEVPLSTRRRRRSQGFAGRVRPAGADFDRPPHSPMHALDHVGGCDPPYRTVLRGGAR